MNKYSEGRIVKVGELEKNNSQFIEKGYAKALEVMRADEIDINDFKNCQGFNKETIEKDIAYVKRTEESFVKNSLPEREDARKLAMIFEAIIHEQSELSDWLGPDVITRKASRFDDLGNGIDTIAEFARPDGDLILAIDVTTTNPTKKL